MGFVDIKKGRGKINMKKVINMAFIYSILGLIGGLYYRELAKYQGFSGKTQLAVVHTHLFMLGMVMMLLVYLFTDRMNLHKDKRYKSFFIIYNAGVMLTAIMMTLRGTLQVVGFEFTKGLDSAIAGVAGIGHILVGLGFVLFMLMLKKGVAVKTES